MSNQTLAIILGGVIPAVFFALFNIFQKCSVRHSTSGFYFMLVVGLTASICSAVIIFFKGDKNFTWQGGAFGVMSGMVWVVGISLISYTLNRFNFPLSKITPIYNANTLLVVLISLVVFSEWRDVNLPKAIAATLMIIGGSILLSKS